LSPPHGARFRFDPGQFAWFASRAGELKPGTTVYVDGPHGVFSVDQDEGPGFCFIGGGVGITGLLSMLRTMADREDARPAVLIYANRDWESVAFPDELKRLQRRMNLTLVHGPAPMMDAAESALLAPGVPGERVHTERFNVV
jgi:ferredoxin-NADP reductase